ncbi:phage tail sheath subtilisin-like domain-containing protein [Phaeobacter italicus]|uniref:phage tail sheath subtilisin-like domain-containing protein n=1 Tax=Phaeobacter italicus TaxID=481446 RepID=UPI002FDAEF8D
MTFLTQHHGTRLKESKETPVLVKYAPTAVVGLVGTAPDADPDKFPLNKPILLKGRISEAAGLGDSGTLMDAIKSVFYHVGAYVVFVRVAEGADATETLANVLGDAALKTGVHALLRGKAVTGLAPTLLAVPGFTSSDGQSKPPVVSALESIVEELEAIGFVDGPDLDDAAAIAYRQQINSGRIMIVDSKRLEYDAASGELIPMPGSSYAAGLQAWVDEEYGPQWSLSNKPASKGVEGWTRVADYPKQSNLLNFNQISTIVNHGDGPVFWGNRLATGDDIWSFISVRRVADIVNKAVRRSFLPFVDRPFSTGNVKLMLEAGNAALRSLKAQGVLIGGKMWLDPELNTPEDMAAGKITLSFDLEPPAPMEDVRFMAHRNIEYYLPLTQSALKSAA